MIEDRRADLARTRATDAVTGTRRRAYAIQDPYDHDALAFMRTIDAYFGLRPACLYTDPKGRHYGERMFPFLRGERIEATYDVDPSDPADIARRLSQAHDILAVIPYREDTVELCAELTDHLGLDWIDPAVLRRFRDKHAMRRHIRAVAPDVRVTDSHLIDGPDALVHLADRLATRFVVKPNDGFGNRSIGVFDRHRLDEAIAHVGRHRDTAWIVEEYVGGVEYHIDGLVRGDGTVVTLAVYEYLRTAVNGSPTVYVGEVACRSDESVFGVLTGYAEAVLAATALRRSPFHMEVKIDEVGPCLIDLGARFPSEGGAANLSRLHPTRPDAIAVACHDYFSTDGHFGTDDFATEPVDWRFYNAARTVFVYGISTEYGMIESLDGVADVEALPEFVRWSVLPRVGDPLFATRDLRGAPYIVELDAHGSRGDGLALIETVRSMIRINERPAPRLTRATLGGRDVARRTTLKASWVAHRTKTAMASAAALAPWRHDDAILTTHFRPTGRR